MSLPSIIYWKYTIQSILSRISGSSDLEEWKKLSLWGNMVKTLIINGSPRINGDTASLLDVGSRLQTYFCAKFFRKEKPIAKSKRGAVVLVGGGDGNMKKPYETACTLLHHMNCYNIHEVVFSHNTNVRPAIEDEQVLNGIHSIIEFFNDVP